MAYVGANQSWGCSCMYGPCCNPLAGQGQDSRPERPPLVDPDMVILIYYSYTLSHCYQVIKLYLGGSKTTKMSF